MTRREGLGKMSVVPMEGEKVGMVPNGSIGTLLSGPMRTNFPTVFVMGDINLNQFFISLFLNIG